MSSTAEGIFDIELTPGSPEVEGAVGRFDFANTFHGDLETVGEVVLT